MRQQLGNTCYNHSFPEITLWTRTFVSLVLDKRDKYIGTQRSKQRKILEPKRERLNSQKKEKKSKREMEDSVMETENLVHPMNLSPKGGSKVREDYEEEDDDKKDHEAKGREESQAGFINNLLSNLVPGGEAEEEKEHDEDRRGSFGEDKYEDKGVGLISHYISNLVSPLSPKAEKFNEQRVEDFEVENGGSSKVKEDVDGSGNGGQLKQEKIEDEEGGGGGHGGGGIIDNLVSHLPASLTANAAPTTDEASMLIHSIIHD